MSRRKACTIAPVGIGRRVGGGVFADQAKALSVGERIPQERVHVVDAAVAEQFAAAGQLRKVSVEPLQMQRGDASLGRHVPNVRRQLVILQAHAVFGVGSLLGVGGVLRVRAI